jgi:hypothetical protein
MCRIGFMGLLVFLPWGTAAVNDSKKPDSGKEAKRANELTPAEQLKAVKQEWCEKQNEAFRTYGKAHTGAEKTQLLRALPNPNTSAEKALALAEKLPKDPVAVEALVWAATLGSNPVRNRAINILLRDHVDSDELGPVAESLGYSRWPKAEEGLRRLMDKSPHYNVRGLACYSLARQLGRKANADGASQAQRDKFNKERLPLLEQVISKYGDIKFQGKMLADAVPGDVYELKNLMVGMPAPEIEGKDTDGNGVKLRDYRGRVVLLDFWGNW